MVKAAIGHWILTPSTCLKMAPIWGGENVSRRTIFDRQFCLPSSSHLSSSKRLFHQRRLRRRNSTTRWVLITFEFSTITKLEFASFVHKNRTPVAGFGLRRLSWPGLAKLLQWSITRESLSAPTAAVSGMDVLSATVWFRCQPTGPDIRQSVTAHDIKPVLQVISFK